MIEFAYNNIIHFSTKITFFFVLYEQHFCISLNVKNNVSRKKTNAINQQEMNSAVNQYLKKLQEM